MEYVITKPIKMEVIPCKRCGVYPKFIRPDDYHSDTWLECPICKKRTANTGGYHYASEISIERANRDAIIEWNDMNENKFDIKKKDKPIKRFYENTGYFSAENTLFYLDSLTCSTMEK